MSKDHSGYFCYWKKDKKTGGWKTGCFLERKICKTSKGRTGSCFDKSKRSGRKSRKLLKSYFLWSCQICKKNRLWQRNRRNPHFLLHSEPWWGKDSGRGGIGRLLHAPDQRNGSVRWWDYWHVSRIMADRRILQSNQKRTGSQTRICLD